MAMRDDDGADSLTVLLKVLAVGERVVGARRIVFDPEVETNIEHKDVAIHIEREHVTPDLLDAP